VRLLGWGLLWGVAVIVLPFLGINAIPLLLNPRSSGYLLFVLPPLIVGGLVVGASGGAIAALLAPLARTGAGTRGTLVRCAVLHALALGGWLTVLMLVLPDDTGHSWGPLVPMITAAGTALATWGLAQERRRAHPPQPVRAPGGAAPLTGP
jgi:hypothetical protein